MSKELSRFIDFIKEQGIVGLAVGLAIGLVASAAVTSIVDGLINPLVGFILGGAKLSEMEWHTGLYHNKVELIFGYGVVINALLVLLATALVVYYMVRVFRLDKLDNKKDEKIEKQQSSE